MHKTALRYGIIASVILIALVSIFFFGFRSLFLSDTGKVLGFLSIVISMLMVFFGIKGYRDKEQDGHISFGKAFGIGVYIAGVGSLLYGIFEGAFYGLSDSREIYWEFYSRDVRNSGQSPELIQQQLNVLQAEFAIWDDPFMMGLFNFFNVFVVGLIIALISAAILRKTKRTS